jgi:UrcA family protein
MKLAVLFGLLAINVAAAAFGHAEDTYTVHKHVSFSYGDLATIGGQDQLYQRLRAAAAHVCGGSDTENKAFKYILGPKVSSCMNGALIDATARINVPAFSSYVASKMTFGAAIKVASR